MRYFHMMNLDQRTAHERLTRICFIDYDREMALVAEQTDPETGERDHGRIPPEPPQRRLHEASSRSSSATASSAGASVPCS